MVQRRSLEVLSILLNPRKLCGGGRFDVNQIVASQGWGALLLLVVGLGGVVVEECVGGAGGIDIKSAFDRRKKKKLYIASKM